MKKRITALLLCCVMLLTLCPGLISTATAYDDTQPDQAEATGETVQPTVNLTNVAPFLPPVSGGVRMQRAASFAAANFAANDAANFAATDNGMKISKTAKANGDGSYTITLEAYATGSKVISEVTEDIPTDIVLVLDQSGSMAYDMTSYTYDEAYPGSNHSGTYYVQSGGSYVKVTWCSDCGAWTDGCTDFIWHFEGEKYSPKTSAEDTEAGHVQFYSPVTRLDALKTAVTNFADAVAEKAAGKDGDITTTADNIDHRIAVVGYADTDWDYGYNTGVFIGSTLKRYENDAAGVYSTALQDMSTTNGKSNVAASLNALQASGATRTDYGLTMANGILNANPVPTGETRNRVVIVFTDGSPTNSNGFQRAVANSAISTANAIKAGGTTVYSIGIFSGADASTAGKEPDEDYEDSLWGPNYTDAEMSAACNWFMQKVSSNNGTPRTPSYYLSAGDSASLNNIFQQISDQIETGGTTSTLTSDAVVKDIISPQFTLPAGATADNITLETYQCTGKNGDVYTWSKNENAMGAEASIGSTDESNATTKNNQVSVTGFNFSENWVGTETNADGSTTYHGNKLVIKFTVKPRDGFLGGNSVITNTNAGIYENATAENPVLTFEQPKVDVTIGNISVSNVESNVYLGGYYSVSVPAEQIKTQMTATCGGVTLDLTQENFGLEEWQYEYVNIVVTVKDADGNDLTGGIESLTEDVAYTVTITVTPKTTGGSATEKTGSGTDTIHVFKPELTFKDGEVYYGDSVPTAFGGNLTNTRWVHYNANGAIDKVAGAEGVSMLNSQPTLTLTYTPGTGIVDGIINTTNDIPVAVTAKIDSTDVTDHTTFVHTKCADDNTCTDPANGKFWLHVNTCTLTVQKSGWDEKDANQSFIFNVSGGEIAQNIKVTVQKNGSATIVGLPVGSYTVTEDSKWSWRYTANGNGSATLSAVNHDAEVTITNQRTATKWLSGDNYAVNHVGGIKMPQGTFAGSN